ncbi:MAG: transcription antitermination factor NusB [Xanthomonadaceae bacterium]|nr:transcription antitermination factor NusB [Xanthomonadaceae bacterium]
MKTPRTRAREAAFQILYHMDLEADATKLPYPIGNALEQLVDTHFKHWDIGDSSHEFAKQLIYGSLREITKIDELLSTGATNWKLSRMAAVDRTLLRLGAFEILFCSDIPPKVTMDEYIEMAKLFGTAETAGFINGILDSISKSNPKSV